MPPKFETQPPSTTTTTPSNPSTTSIDPIILILWILPYSFLHASDQLRTTFFPDRVNRQYINRMSIFRVHVHSGWDRHCAHGLARDRNRVKSVIVLYATAGISSVVLAYVMSMLLIRIKIPDLSVAPLKLRVNIEICPPTARFNASMNIGQGRALCAVWVKVAALSSFASDTKSLLLLMRNFASISPRSFYKIS
ncbi:unnamed protein product [Malus baccata var. baccata]